MLLNRINYKNFRPFIGEQKIDLTTSENKNVIVLLGNNTAGKTTFVLSFVWCLYGESKFNKKDSILNQKIFNQMQNGDTEEAYVEIGFSDNNKQYIVKRCQKFKKENNTLISNEAEFSIVYTDIEGKTYSVNSEAEKEEVIKAILPHDLSPYFFFEGEKDNKMNKGDLGDAVRNLLGLKAYDNMKKHLFGPADAKTFRSNSVLGMLNTRILDTDSEEVKRTLAREKELEEKVTSLQNDLKICAQNRESYKNKINEITDKLRRAEPSKNIQEFIDSLEKQIAKDEEELRTLSIKYLKNFGKESIHLLIKPMLSKVDDRLKVLNIADKGIRGLEASAITSLLKRGKCLCGTELYKGSLAYNEVYKYYELLPPKSVGTLVMDLQDQMKENTAKGEEFYNNFSNLYKEIIRKRDSINNNDIQLTNEKNKLKEIGNVDIIQLEDMREKYQKYLEQLEEESNEKQVAIKMVNKDLDDIKEKLEKFKNKDKKNDKFKEQFAYAKAIYDWVERNYFNKETAMRKKLNKYVSTIFNNMYSGKREICIDTDYNVILSYNGSSVDDTGGLRAVQYFAYVAGLVKLAYEVMNTKDGELENMGEEYPLVLDAAFSHADDIHTKNVARELSKSVNQLIFALMYKDWNYAKDGIEFNVARKYEFQKIDEIEVRIVEVK